ncbi:MAG: hypothetical protein UH854_05295, partial [Clostridia bacterium]|nr:hypothetical protein [Clostridia bacterium]
MKKTSYYKRTVQNLGIFAFIAIMLAMLIIPSYSVLFSSVKDDIVLEYDDKIQQQLKLMENEINLQKNVLKSMSEGMDFNVLSNPSFYGYSVNSVQWFESRESVKESFAELRPLISLQDKTLLMFRNGDLQININGAVDTFSAGYDTTWNLSDDGDVYSSDAAYAQIFMKLHSGKVDKSLCYNDLNNEQSYDIVYTLTLSSSDEDMGESTFVACYDAEKLLKRLNLDEVSSSVLLTTIDDGKIVNYGNNYDVSVYDSFVKNENLGIKLHYSISESSIRNKLSPINFFLIIFTLGFIFFGILATIGISVVEIKHIKRVVSVAEGTTDVKYSTGDDYLKYLEMIFRNLYDNRNKAAENVKSLVFLKMLNFRLSEDELKLVQDYFKTSVSVLMLKNTDAKYRNVENDVSAYLKKKNIEIIHIDDIENSEVMVLVQKTSSVREIFADMIVYLNKEHHTDIRGVLSVCDDIEQMPGIFARMKKSIPYIEYGSLKFIDVNSYKYDEEDFKSFMAKGRQLYEIIRSGNEFEAKRAVYEQWYKVTQGQTDAGVAEALFFSQSTVLNQIASEYKVNVSIPRFDSSKDAVSVAFEITE